MWHFCKHLSKWQQRKKYILCIFNRIYTQDSHRQYLFFHAEYPLKSVFAILSTHNTFHMNINTTIYDLLSLTFKHTRECELCDMHAKIHFRFWCILCLSGGIFILFLLDCMFVFVVSCLLMLQNIPEAHMLNISYYIYSNWVNILNGWAFGQEFRHFFLHIRLKLCQKNEFQISNNVGVFVCCAFRIWKPWHRVFMRSWILCHTIPHRTT